MVKPVGPFFNNVTLVASCAALIGAAWAGYSALVVLLGLGLSAALVTRVWSRLCLKGVSCERQLSERRVFPDEEVVLTLRVVNRKLLPLPWVEIRDEVPELLAAAGTATGSGPGDTAAEILERPGFVALSRSTPLLWYSAASFSQRLESSARGYYALGPLSVTSGDIFGLHPRSHTRSDLDHLIVYPRTYELAELGIPSLSLLGDSKSALPMLDDPSRLMGVREYSAGDNPRRIHWKASARSRALQVKLFESTTDVKVSVFLAIDSFAGRPKDDFELGVSTAASIARHLIERGVQTGLFANTKLADTLQPAYIAPGGGTAPLALILETLAKTTEETAESFVDFFERERGGLGFGATLVFVLAELSPEVRLLLTELTGTGRRVLCFGVGSQDRAAPAPQDKAAPMGQVRWYTVKRPSSPAEQGSAGPVHGAAAAEGAAGR